MRNLYEHALARQSARVLEERRKRFDPDIRLIIREVRATAVCLDRLLFEDCLDWVSDELAPLAGPAGTQGFGCEQQPSAAGACRHDRLAHGQTTGVGSGS